MYCNVLNVFIDIQTSKELIQMDTDKMMYCHDLEVMDSNPGHVKVGVDSASVVREPKI